MPPHPQDFNVSRILATNMASLPLRIRSMDVVVGQRQVSGAQAGIADELSRF